MHKISYMYQSFTTKMRTIVFDIFKEIMHCK